MSPKQIYKQESVNWAIVILLFSVPIGTGSIFYLLGIVLRSMFQWDGFVPALIGLLASAVSWAAIIIRITDVIMPRKSKSSKVKRHHFDVRTVSKDGKTLYSSKFPAHPAQIYSLAVGLLDGRSFTEAQWCEGPDSVFSRATFVRVRDQFVKEKWAYWRTPGVVWHGVEVTHAGRAVMRDIRDNLPTRLRRIPQ